MGLGLANYLATPLEVCDNPWMQWAGAAAARLGGGPSTAAFRQVAPAGVKALGSLQGWTQTWSGRRKDGRWPVRGSAARRPAPRITSMALPTRTTSLYTRGPYLVGGWLRPAERKWAAGTVYLDGRAPGRSGRSRPDALPPDRSAPWFVDSRWPRAGSPSSGSYEGTGATINDSGPDHRGRNARWRGRW